MLRPTGMRLGAGMARRPYPGRPSSRRWAILDASRERRSVPMPPCPVARLALTALLGLVAWVAPGGPVPAAAQPLKNVGDERVIGKNRTGEECRLRLLDRR